MSWGFNNVAIKLAIHDIPPLIQSSARSLIAAFLVGIWTQARGIPLFKRDGALGAGILAGVLFALEFLLIYRGLVWTTATRGVLFLYLAPFFVVIGSRWLVPAIYLLFATNRFGNGLGSGPHVQGRRLPNQVR